MSNPQENENNPPENQSSTTNWFPRLDNCRPQWAFHAFFISAWGFAVFGLSLAEGHYTVWTLIVAACGAMAAVLPWAVLIYSLARTCYLKHFLPQIEEDSAAATIQEEPHQDQHPSPPLQRQPQHVIPSTTIGIQGEPHYDGEQHLFQASEDTQDVGTTSASSSVSKLAHYGSSRSSVELPIHVDLSEQQE